VRSLPIKAETVLRVNHATDGTTRDCDLEYWRHDAVLVEVETP
jgi:hypothetical protein